MDVEKQRLAIKDLVRQYSANNTSLNANSTSVDDCGLPDTVAEPIAIVGLSGYLPASGSVEEFWRHLDQDASLIQEIPSTRFDWKSYFCETNAHHRGAPDQSMRCKWGGFIPAVKDFDPHFFKILPDEAELMDPQQRLLLMAVYNTLENAGYAPGALKGSNTGVFVGFERNEYLLNLMESGRDTGVNLYQSDSMIANNISYYFDFVGPSEMVNTMCSGAAVAIHRAVSALRSGEIQQAIVGAANLLLRPDTFIKLSLSEQMSTGPLVKSFGSDADGYLRAEGVCSVMLKPYSAAVADGDAVYALIRNSAVNYNGKSSASIAAPNTTAHASLVHECYRKAGIDPGKIDYIEAQGMGNPVADICEWDAFNRALKTLATEQGVDLIPGHCKVSTLKPMAGHMHAASALGALFKVIRSLETEKIHKIVGLQQVSADIETENAPCELLRETIPWPKNNTSRLAGIHSYGAGGNNAHILVEGVDEKVERKDYKEIVTDTGLAIPVSAQTKDLFVRQLEALRDSLQKHNLSLGEVAFTLQWGRDTHEYRTVFFSNTIENLLEQIDDVLSGQSNANVFSNADELPKRDGEMEAAAEWLETGSAQWPKLPACYRKRVHLPGTIFNCQPYWINATNADQGEIKSIPYNKSIEIDAGEQPVISENSSHKVTVLNILAQHLRLSPGEIDVDREFSDMGFDSMLVSRLSKDLGREYGVEIEPAVFFEVTTPAGLIDYCNRTLNINKPDAVAETDASACRFASQVGKQNVVAETDQSVSRYNSQERKPVAIIGMAGKYPDSSDLGEFWQNLVQGKSCVKEIPSERWSVEKYFDPASDGEGNSFKANAKWGGFLDDLNCFDHEFFNLTPFEASYMSPKERLFMQCSWHAIEDAGYTTKALESETVGVFVGISKAGFDNYKDSYFSVANRISYRFNFCGPSMPIDTACSSSLSAIHEACLHLQSGECSVALAGGVNAYTHPSTFAEFSRLNVLSKDGVLRAFGADANGFVPGEGVGAILLKPLEKAVADGDHIYGVIRGSAINHGGKVNGYTVPSPQAHRRLIRSAIVRSGVSARDISYVEAHGTGTVLGDPVEIRGLTDAYREDTSDSQYCALGSVKTNIGHLEAAAGIAGLTKVLLQMKFKKIAPTLNVEESNPQIDFSASPFMLQRELTDWSPTTADAESGAVKRCAGISSFGAGGSNAHIVVEEASCTPAQHPSESPSYLFVLSAKTEQALGLYAEKFIDYLKENRSVSLAEMTYTLQVGREAMKHRMACEIDSTDMLLDKLTAYRQGEIPVGFWQGTVNRKQVFRAFSEDHSARELVRRWLDERKFSYLAELWTQGETIDWIQWIQGQPRKYQRISLPGYPFEQTPIPKAPMLVPADGIGGLAQLTTVLSDDASMLVIEPRWEALVEDALSDGLSDQLDHRVILCDYAAAMKSVSVEHLKSTKTHPAGRFEEYCIKLAEIYAGITKSKNKKPTLIQVVVPQGDEASSTLPAISALQKTFSLENNRVTAQVIELPEGLSSSTVQGLLSAAGNQPGRHWFRFSGEKLMGLGLKVLPGIEVSHPWKSKGVYLITGGLGQLGFLCARDIASKAEAPVLILTGQRALDETRTQQIKILRDAGATVHYEAADLTSSKAVIRLVNETVEAHGRITGVIHCAGVICDGLLLNKEVDDIQRVLAPKTYGTWNLGEACEHVELDFFVLFSSAVSLVGNPGQADYAAANAFMDLYARNRQGRADQGACFGKTRSIAWGLWQDGGMQVSPDILESLHQMSGMRPITASAGLATLYQAISGDQVQVVAIAGDRDRLLQHFNSSIGSDEYRTNAAPKLTKSNPGVARETSRLSADILGVDQSVIDLGAAFDELGLGVVELHSIVNHLNQIYSFDFNLNSLSGYNCLQEFIEAYSDALSCNGINVEAQVESSGNLSETVVTQLNKVLSQVTGYPVEKLHADTGFDDLGIDSLMIVNMTNKLEKVYGELPKTLFFEYQTIGQLAAYFVRHHASTIARTLSDKSDQQEGQYALPSTTTSQRAMGVEAIPQKIRTKNLSKSADIAIVGLAGRYPQADNLEEFWQVLSGGKDCITEIPVTRWNHAAYFDPERGKPGKTYAKWGGFINGVDEFDPGFFNISPREAEIIEPQERLFLQTAYEVIEDAGYTRKALADNAILDGMTGAVGVYVGVTYQEYQLYGAQETLLGRPMVLSMSPSSIANRVSYFCDFHGPSMAVDTMCASSLTTVHLACQSLLNGECKAAIAGGVNVSIHPAKYLMLGYGGFASASGRCKTFSEHADGYVPSEGVGAVLLKPLHDAVEDGDHIYGIIKGSAVNHGGRTYGYSVPNPAAQEAVIRRAISSADVNPQDISYMEAHGTGTSLGDPIEISALNKAFGQYWPEGQSCSIGSVKSNIGHCESAAGIAGLTKVILQMQHKQLVPSLHAEQINPKIEFNNSPFAIQKTLEDWEQDNAKPRVAGISSFGAGGSNAHLILQEAPVYESEKASNSANLHLIVLSANTSDQLDKIATSLLRQVAAGKFGDSDLVRVAYTLQVGREAFSNRLAFFAYSLDELKSALNIYLKSGIKADQSVKWLDGKICLGLADESIAQNRNDIDLSKIVALGQQGVATDNMRLNEILEAWVEGVSIQWSDLYGTGKPRKIALPTYPFTLRRYWKPATDAILQNTVTEDEKSSRIRLTAPQAVTAENNIALNADPRKSISERGSVQLIDPKRVSAGSHQTTRSTLSNASNQTADVDNQKVLKGDIAANASRGREVIHADASVATVKEYLRESLAGALMMMPGEIDNNTAFSDIGLDSIVGVEWIRAINTKYSLQLPADSVHQNSDINRFSEYLQAIIKGQGQQKPDIEAAPPGGNDNLPQARDEYTDTTMQKVIKSLSKALLLDESEIKTTSRFVDLGLDSIVGVEWIREINKEFGTHFEASSIYEYPTPGEFCRYLEGQVEKDREHNQITSNRNLSPGSQGTFDKENKGTASTFQFLQSSLADVLMMESKEIIETARFSDLGLDSITGMEWVRHINQVMDLSLEADVVYKHKTLKRFVEHIESMLNHRNTEKVFTDINTMGEHQSLDAASVLDHVEEGILDVDTAYKLLEEAL